MTEMDTNFHGKTSIDVSLELSVYRFILFIKIFSHFKVLNLTEFHENWYGL